MGMPVVSEGPPSQRVQPYWYAACRLIVAIRDADRLVDRELTLVPKKGRPVTQCQHCRQERKKRSAHVSCDCAGVEKPHHPKEKCIHLREAEERVKSGLQDGHPVYSVEQDAAHLTAVAEEQGCCCTHGGKCSCALLKKEGQQDSGESPPHGPAVKPRLETTKSEGSITVFQNGHHKPVHRRNHLAHESGMPYKMPMPRAHTDQNISAKARRSVDSLPLHNNMPFDSSAFTPQISAPFNTERRMSKSEQPSPKMSALDAAYPAYSNARLSPLDFSNIGFTQASQGVQTSSNDNFAFVPLEPISGVTESFPSWSSLPTDGSTSVLNNDPFDLWATNPDSNGTAQPALTAASSGTQSEVDEIPPLDDMYSFGMPSIQEDGGNFNFSNFVGSSPQQSNRRSLPPNFFKSAEFMMPSAGDDWQQILPNEPAGNGQNFQQKQFDDPQAVSFDDAWQMPTYPPMADLPHRHIGGLYGTGRPVSQAFGQADAPNDDLRQLFPELEDNRDIYDPSGTYQDMNDAGKNMSSVNATSAAMDFGPIDEAVDFAPHSWDDGSISIPNDTFTSSYDLSQDFSGTDFNGNWSQ